ncbi:MAG: DNA-directed RNA polymerase subunit alpha C-terminal domain-containing protein [Pseudomonadota bacterium]
MNSKSQYDWAAAIAAIVASDSSRLAELASVAQLDPVGGDLSDIDLSDLDISGQDLAGWDLRNAKLTNARLAGANLLGALVEPESLVDAIDWRDAKLDESVRLAAERAAISRADLLDSKIERLELSPRVRQTLTLAEVVYLGELVQRSEAEVLRMPNSGRKVLQEIKDRLGEYRLHLGTKLPEWIHPNLRDR